MTESILRCAFLTMEDESAFVTDYRPGIPPLEALGWSVDCVPWRRPGTDWDAYDAVYIGAPWDYTEDPARFMSSIASRNTCTISGSVVARSYA